MICLSCDVRLCDDGMFPPEILHKYGYECVPGGRTDVVALKERGLANIKKGDKWGYINEQNELIIACKYDCCETFRNGKATVWLDFVYSTIDTEGNTVECDNEDGLPF